MSVLSLTPMDLYAPGVSEQKPISNGLNWIWWRVVDLFMHSFVLLSTKWKYESESSKQLEHVSRPIPDIGRPAASVSMHFTFDFAVNVTFQRNEMKCFHISWTVNTGQCTAWMSLSLSLSRFSNRKSMQFIDTKQQKKIFRPFELTTST